MYPLCATIHKVFYLVNSNRRFTSERSNLSYGVTSFFLAETIVTCLAQLLWVPGCSLAFFMVSQSTSIQRGPFLYRRAEHTKQLFTRRGW